MPSQSVPRGGWGPGHRGHEREEVRGRAVAPIDFVHLFSHFATFHMSSSQSHDAQDDVRTRNDGIGTH